MKALVVCESMFGNTMAVARAVESGLSRHLDVRLLTAGTAGAVDEDVDLVVVGGPTHAFSMSRPKTRADALDDGAAVDAAARGIREWLADLAPARAGALVATFDTRVDKVRHLPGSAARKAAKVASGLGFRVVLPPISFYVSDLTGPLLDGEIERALAWGDLLGARVVAAVQPSVG